MRTFFPKLWQIWRLRDDFQVFDRRAQAEDGYVKFKR